MEEETLQNDIPASRPVRAFEDGEESVLAVAVFPDGERMVTSGKTLRLWNLKEGVVLKTMKGHRDRVWAVAISRNGELIASGDEQGELIFWQGNNGASLSQTIKAHTTWISSVDFSPIEAVLATGSSDWMTKLWNTETRQPEGDPIDCGAPVHCVRYSSKGLLAIAAGNYIQIWNASARDCIANLDVPGISPNLSLAWIPDGTRLLSAGSYSDSTIREWDSCTWKQVGDPWNGHTGDIMNIVTNPTGTLVASASHDKTVRLWRLSDRQTIASFMLRHSGNLFSIAFSIDGKHIIGSGHDKKVSEWAVPKDALHGDAAQCTDPKILAMSTTVRNACISGDLDLAEQLLTQEIGVDPDNYVFHANRAVVMTRKSDWDQAFHDARKSLSIRPSLIGYIAKGIALRGQNKVQDAMRTFDIAFMFANQDPKAIHFLLLVKAIALFDANQCEEAISRVQGLADDCPNADTHACRVVKAYLSLQLGINSWEEDLHEDAIDYFTVAIETSAFSSKWDIHVIYEDFVVLFGWDLKTMWQTANKLRCETLLFVKKHEEALKSYQYMMDMSDETMTASCMDWSINFKQQWSSVYASDGDEALSVKDYDRAISLYSAVIDMDSGTDTVFANRCRAKLEKKDWKEALLDAQRVIELNPSFYSGYELKHAALHGAKNYDEAVEALETMVSNLDDAPDVQIRKLRLRYLSRSEAEDAIRKVIDAQLEHAPLRLLNTYSGLLCDREAQTKAFAETIKYKRLLSLTMKVADFRTERITDVVKKYFRCAMLSHRWEGKEPMLHDIQGKVVYDLNHENVTKLRHFCHVAHREGFCWAWIDTCCIDQHNHIELEESLNKMFVWYRHSARTFVYLSDVSPSSRPGALAKSAWNKRGWTLPEFLASKIVFFYQNDWTPYLDDRSPNHKHSSAIMQELEEATGINADTLANFIPGTTDAREKLRWASTRVTTVPADAAYSLFGIFGVNLAVIYGETRQNALGRLLEEIVARSGDISALDWIGRSSEYNSCLPADITAYEAPPFTQPSLSEEEMRVAVSQLLQDPGVVELALQLYTKLENYETPRSYRRIHLPCIPYLVTEIIRRPQDQETYNTYEVKAEGLQNLTITTEDRLIPFTRARPAGRAFFLVRPWNRHLLEVPDFAEDQSVEGSSFPDSITCDTPEESPGETEEVDVESQLRALRLLIRLEQPFGALLLAQQPRSTREYKRIATDRDIVAQVRDKTYVYNMDVKTLEIL